MIASHAALQAVKVCTTQRRVVGKVKDMYQDCLTFSSRKDAVLSAFPWRSFHPHVSILVHPSSALCFRFQMLTPNKWKLLLTAVILMMHLLNTLCTHPDTRISDMMITKNKVLWVFFKCIPCLPSLYLLGSRYVFFLFRVKNAFHPASLSFTFEYGRSQAFKPLAWLNNVLYGLGVHDTMFRTELIDGRLNESWLAYKGA